MPSNPQRIIIIQTAGECVRRTLLVIWSAKLLRPESWEHLFELVYNFTMLKNLYLIVEVEHFFTNFSFLIANIFFFLN